VLIDFGGFVAASARGYYLSVDLPGGLC